MSENLRATAYSDGAKLLDGTAEYIFSEWDSTKYFFYYDDLKSNMDEIGLLYTWAAANNRFSGKLENESLVQGICPDGWHLPDEKEWEQLFDFIGRENLGNWETSELLRTVDAEKSKKNKKGFSLLPGGMQIPPLQNHPHRFALNHQPY